MEFNHKLYELRKQKGLSQEELANKLNVSRQTVSKWELGDSTPDMEKLIGLSDLFDISLDELVLGKEAKAETQEAKTMDIVHAVEEKVLTQKNKKVAQKGMKIAMIILGVIVAIDVISMVIYFLFMLTGCANVENSTMLYQISYPQGQVTSTSMYGDVDYNSYHLENKELDDGKIDTVSVHFSTEPENESSSYEAVSEDGDFVLECKYADGTVKNYEYDSDLCSENGTQIVLRSEYLEDAESLLVFVEEWNSHFYTAYIDGYLEQTETYRIDLRNGEILWKKKTKQNELMLTADFTQDGDVMYCYKEGAVYRLAGEQFEQVEKIGELAAPNRKMEDELVFDLKNNPVQIYYKNTPEKVEFEFTRLADGIQE